MYLPHTCCFLPVRQPNVKESIPMRHTDKVHRVVLHLIDQRISPRPDDGRGGQGFYGRLARFAGQVNGCGWARRRLSAYDQDGELRVGQYFRHFTAHQQAREAAPAGFASPVVAPGDHRGINAPCANGAVESAMRRPRCPPRSGPQHPSAKPCPGCDAPVLRGNESSSLPPETPRRRHRWTR